MSTHMQSGVSDNKVDDALLVEADSIAVKTNLIIVIGNYVDVVTNNAIIRH